MSSGMLVIFQVSVGCFLRLHDKSLTQFSYTGVTVPMLYISMLFSSQCWYRNPHFLPQIHYLHSGSDTVW